MGAIAAKDYVTVEDYANLPDGEWQKWELSNGQLVPRYGEDMGARTDHNRLRAELTTELGIYLRSNPRGVLLGEQDYELLNGVVRRPDISIVLSENLGLLAEKPAIAVGAPDIAIEIVFAFEHLRPCRGEDRPTSRGRLQSRLDHAASPRARDDLRAGHSP